MEITKHFVATVYIVHDNRVLLHLHKKLNLVLPPGGHIERDELPEEAALREVKEETGLEIEFFGGDRPMLADEHARHLLPPQHLILENINPYHQHIDFVYFAHSRSADFQAEDGESERWHWYLLEELDQVHMPSNVRLCAKQALELAKSHFHG